MFDYRRDIGRRGSLALGFIFPKKEDEREISFEEVSKKIGNEAAREIHSILKI